MLKNIVYWILKKLCNHNYSADTQIRVIKCDKCCDMRWYDYKDVFKK